VFIKRRYQYHTPEDLSKNMPKGSLQHLGQNVLALTRGISKEPSLPTGASPFRVIFQDFSFGTAVLVDPFGSWISLNMVLIAAIWISLLSYSFIRVKIDGLSSSNVRFFSFQALLFAFSLLSLLFSPLWAALFLYLADLVSPLRYYGNPRLFVALAFFLCLQGMLLPQWLFQSLIDRKIISVPRSPNPRIFVRNSSTLSIIFGTSILAFAVATSAVTGYFMVYLFFWLLFLCFGFLAMISLDLLFIPKSVNLADKSVTQAFLSSSYEAPVTPDEAEEQAPPESSSSPQEPHRRKKGGQERPFFSSYSSSSSSSSRFSFSSFLQNFLQENLSILGYMAITFSFPWILTTAYLIDQADIALPTLGEGGTSLLVGLAAIYAGIFVPFWSLVPLLSHTQAQRGSCLLLLPLSLLLLLSGVSLPPFSPLRPAKIDAFQFLAPPRDLRGTGPALQDGFSLRSNMLSVSSLRSLASAAFPEGSIDCEPEFFFRDDADYSRRCMVFLPASAPSAPLPSLPSLRPSSPPLFEAGETLLSLSFLAPGSPIVRLEMKGAFTRWSFNDTRFPGNPETPLNAERISAWNGTDWDFQIWVKGELSPQNPVKIRSIVFYDDPSYAHLWDQFYSSLDHVTTTFSSGSGRLRLKTDWVFE